MSDTQSTTPNDYEILIRRYDNGANYAAYFPQLAIKITCPAQEVGDNLMKEHLGEQVAVLSAEKRYTLTA